MLTYVLRRLIYSIPVLAASSFIIFIFVASTTDPLETARMNPRVSTHSLELVIKQNHLDRPLVERYGYWVRDAFTNDFGHMIVGDRPILPELERVLGHTIQLVIGAEAVALVLAIGIGVLSAVRQYSLFDYSVTTLSFLGISLPVFWLGLILQITFTALATQTHTRVLYTAGLSSVDPGHGLHFVMDRVQHLVLPVLTLSALNIAGYSRFMRASMLEVISADYLRAARAKGLPSRTVIMRHAVRNALIPLVTLSGLSIGGLLGGAVVTETIFGLDGMGLFFINALRGGETYAIMAWLMLSATFIVFFNLVADLALGFLDPRIRLA